MSTWFIILTLIFITVSVAMSLIILVQRPQGGGLSGAFGGAGGGGTDTAFGGRTGDALTVATVGAFVIYLALAVALNLVDTRPAAPPPEGPAGPAATGIDESGAEVAPGSDPAAAVDDGVVPDDAAPASDLTSEATTEVVPPSAPESVPGGEPDAAPLGTPPADPPAAAPADGTAGAA